ncbi:unnamed protein product [Acanthoscelides obtectus]|uniref:Glycoprotein-N-acetylgalactosamine 3-beta-galactosyltransferase 1 n=1 Tax=Acanthoscelides obtectus TaxID=200917 RepID=A0A9P0PSX3_ACAOB|nr:unnamed protein product [Acanthoscelides obtectus]CAK1668248.1 Glycoprotein-N-acetylgalactosamine 3-beta-galactosyltransferase 1 [Acanthoscelides obtectus]
MTHFYLRVAIFCLGLIIGLYLGCKSATNKAIKSSIDSHMIKHIPSYDNWSLKRGIQRKVLPWDALRYSNITFILEADVLFKEINVLCLIIVRNNKNVQAAENTWARGCNNIHYVETVSTDKKKLPGMRTKEHSSWILLCKVLLDIHHKHDWVLVVNDNTFAIMENLKYYLAPLNPLDKYYLGYAVKFWNTIYNSNEAGYILSKAAIKAFQKAYSEKECLNHAYWNREDFYLGKYLAKLNITPSDAKDKEGLSIFHPYSWYHVFFPGGNYYKTSVFSVKCCSKHSITFKAVEGDKMYTYHYLLYKLQIFTQGTLGNLPYESDVPDEHIWRTFLKERNIHDENITADQYYKVWTNLINDPTSFAAHMKKEIHSVDYS